MMNIKEYISDIIARYGSCLLTKKQAAKELQISPTQIDRLRKTGELRSSMVGGSVRISANAIADFLV